MKIKKVYLGQQQIRPGKPVYTLESIVTKQKADSSWKIYIPYWDTNWKVSIDYNVVQNWWSSTSFSWYTANSEHIVKIEPIVLNYGWAKRYSWGDKTWSIYVLEIIQDKSYVWFADSATSTWDSFRASEYKNCSNLINTAEEYLPDTVTTIWTSFRANQYQSCTSITSPATEVLPNTVTTILGRFRYFQYHGCSSITEASEEVLPNTVTSIWSQFRADQYYNNTSLTSIKWWKDLDLWTISNYREYQFYGCNAQKTVKVLSDVWTAGQTTSLNNTYVTEIQVPTAYLSNFKNTTKNPRKNITDSKFVWY